jgi:hypothetical protein
VVDFRTRWIRVPFTPRRAAFLADWAFLVAAGGDVREGDDYILWSTLKKT